MHHAQSSALLRKRPGLELIVAPWPPLDLFSSNSTGLFFFICKSCCSFSVYLVLYSFSSFCTDTYRHQFCTCRQTFDRQRRESLILCHQINKKIKISVIFVGLGTFLLIMVFGRTWVISTWTRNMQPFS